VKLKVLEHFTGRNLDGYWIVFDEPEVTRAYLAAFWLRDALGTLLPDHEERRRLVYQLANAPRMAEVLEDTNRLALELMERAARIDRKLRKATKSPDDGVELGEIVRLREQLGRNRAVLAEAKQKGDEPWAGASRCTPNSGSTPV
jgi:hypothetical protein